MKPSKKWASAEPACACRKFLVAASASLSLSCCKSDLAEASAGSWARGSPGSAASLAEAELALALVLAAPAGVAAEDVPCCAFVAKSCALAAAECGSHRSNMRQGRQRETPIRETSGGATLEANSGSANEGSLRRPTTMCFEDTTNFLPRL